MNETGREGLLDDIPPAARNKIAIHKYVIYLVLVLGVVLIAAVVVLAVIISGQSHSRIGMIFLLFYFI